MDLEGDEGAKEEDEELLMSVLEAREVIEGAESEGDLEGLQAGNEQRIGDSEGRLQALFATGDWDGAKRETVRLRYWVNVREAIRGWEKGKEVVIVH